MRKCQGNRVRNDDVIRHRARHLFRSSHLSTIYWRFTVYLTLMMTSHQIVETSVNVTAISPFQDYTHQDDHSSPTYDMTSVLKPLTVP